MKHCNCDGEGLRDPVSDPDHCIECCRETSNKDEAKLDALKEELRLKDLQIQEHQNKAAEWVEYVFEKNTEARFKTGYMRGFVQGLAEAFRQGLHLKQTGKRKDNTCPACNGRGFLQFLAGGEQTTCALCDGKKKV